MHVISLVRPIGKIPSSANYTLLQFFLKEKVRYLAWTCRDPISDSRDPIFSLSRDPMTTFCDSRDPILNFRDLNRVPKTP